MALNNQVTSTPATVDSVVEQYIGPQVQTEDLNASGSITINGVPVGGGGAAVWGDITGTLSDQTDLQAELDAKLNVAGPVATGTVTTNIADGLGTFGGAFRATQHDTVANSGPVIQVRRARGTTASPAAVQNGDTLGILSVQGYDGTAFNSGPYINAVATENWSGTARGSMLFLGARPPASTSSATVLRIRPLTTTSGALELPLSGGTNLLSTGTLDIQDGTGVSIASFSTSGIVCNKPFSPPAATLATLPAATTVGQVLFVSNANSGVGTLCFSNGTNWIDVKTGAAVA